MANGNFFSYSLRWRMPLETSEQDSEPLGDMKKVLPIFLNEFGEAPYAQKWETLEFDMKNFSRLYPDCLFSVYVRDWHNCEHYVHYFWNGKAQEQGSTIGYIEPEEEAWH